MINYYNVDSYITCLVLWNLSFQTYLFVFLFSDRLADLVKTDSIVTSGFLQLLCDRKL